MTDQPPGQAPGEPPPPPKVLPPEALPPQALLHYLTQRHQTARAEVDRLTARLDQAQQLLTRLEITRQTLLDLAGHDPAQDAPPLPEPAVPPPYQEILTVLADHPDGMRPKDICHALGLPASKSQIEGARAKLKRLIGRDLATEPEPGRFTIKQHPN